MFTIPVQVFFYKGAGSPLKRKGKGRGGGPAYTSWAKRLPWVRTWISLLGEWGNVLLGTRAVLKTLFFKIADRVTDDCVAGNTFITAEE